MALFDKLKSALGITSPEQEHMKELRDMAVNQLRDRTDPSNPYELAAAQEQAGLIRQGDFDPELLAREDEKHQAIAELRDATDPANRAQLAAAQKQAKAIAAEHNLPDHIMKRPQQVGAKVLESRLPDRGNAEQQAEFEQMSPDAQRAEVDRAHKAGLAVNEVKSDSRSR